MWKSDQGIVLGIVRDEGPGNWRVFIIAGQGAGMVFVMEEAHIVTNFRNIPVPDYPSP